MGWMRILQKKLLVLVAIACIFAGNLFAQMGVVQAVPTVATAQEGIALPILMYHSLLKDPTQANDYVLGPSALEDDLKYLSKQGCTTITIADLIAYTTNQADLPEKPVMITFDDGFYNNYVYAYPLLKEYNMHAVISVLGMEMEKFTANGQINAYWSYLNQTQLQEMVNSGIFEVQNHSYQMHGTTPRKGCLQQARENDDLYKEQLLEDTMRAQALFADADLPTPTCYTYPLGAYNAQSEQILQEMGFQATLCCTEGMNYITRDPSCLFLLKRYNRPSGVSTKKFMDKALGV